MRIGVKVQVQEELKIKKLLPIIKTSRAISASLFFFVQGRKMIAIKILTRTKI